MGTTAYGGKQEAKGDRTLASLLGGATTGTVGLGITGHWTEQFLHKSLHKIVFGGLAFFKPHELLAQF